jgi:hypothetical protein
MSGVFQNIDPPPPHHPGIHSLGGEGVGVDILEDARHSSVLYICKYILCGAYSLSGSAWRGLGSNSRGLKYIYWWLPYLFLIYSRPS